MTNIWTIARRDFRAYFTSPIAYILIAGFLMIMGFFFFFTLNHYISASMQFRFGGGGKVPSLNEGVLRYVFGNMNVVLLFVIPFITMRLLAEEKKLHTIELLMTSPLSLTEIVLGKFLSAILLTSVMLGLTLVYPLILIIFGNPDLGPIISSYIGTFLLAGSYLAVGLMFSSMTENQIVAGVLTFITLLFFWVISWASQSAGPVMSDVLNYLSLIGHYNNFSQGLVSSADCVFYLSFIGLALYITHLVLDSFRWR
jgi:ABC-2 type transport system permease protein